MAPTAGRRGSTRGTPGQVGRHLVGGLGAALAVDRRRGWLRREGAAYVTATLLARGVPCRGRQQLRDPGAQVHVHLVPTSPGLVVLQGATPCCAVDESSKQDSPCDSASSPLPLHLAKPGSPASTQTTGHRCWVPKARSARIAIIPQYFFNCRRQRLLPLAACTRLDVEWQQQQPSSGSGGGDRYHTSRANHHVGGGGGGRVVVAMAKWAAAAAAAGSCVQLTSYRGRKHH